MCGVYVIPMQDPQLKHRKKNGNTEIKLIFPHLPIFVFLLKESALETVSQQWNRDFVEITTQTIFQHALKESKDIKKNNNNKLNNRTIEI